MKFIYIILLSLLFNFSYSQQTPPNTEVYLFDIKENQGEVTLSNGRNISENEGYDNQPYFLNNEYVLFSSNRNGQTDIARYYIKYDSKSWLNFTPGSEYSPIKIPNENAVSAINLQPDGSQKLFKYSLSTGEGSVLIDDIVIGYQLWYDQNTLISAVLENEGLSLYSTNMATGAHIRLAEKIGRSIHHIPNTNLISYISKAMDEWEIRSMDVTNKNSKLITNTLEGSEDMVWYGNSILMGKGSKIHIFKNNSWSEWADLSKRGITNITRLAISKDGNMIAIVGESNGALITSGDDISVSSDSSAGTNNYQGTAAAKIVQSHIEPYNNKDLDGFLEPFAEDVIFNRFPDDQIYQGKEKMRSNYSNYFKNNENLYVTVNKRIELGDYVIDEELAKENNEIHRQVTIYTVKDNNIKTATFLMNDTSNGNAEKVVNDQLKAYNERNIDAFVATYANNVSLYNFPNTIRTEGVKNLRETYADFFDRTPGLQAKIKNRILIGNKVIDHEEVLINGQTINAIAIYEVNDGKIQKVWFIQ